MNPDDAVGDYWNPERPFDRFSGAVRLVDDKPVLCVRLPSGSQTGRRAFNTAEIIHGQLDSGEKVTLWAREGHMMRDAKEEPEHAGDGWLSFSQRFDYRLTGGHLAGLGETLFVRSTFEFQHLSAWSARRVPRAEAELAEFDAAVIKDVYGSGCDVTVRLENWAIIRLDEDGARGTWSLNTSEPARLSFVTSKPMPFDFHDRLVVDAQRLLSWCYQQPALMTRQHIGETESSNLILVEYRRLNRTPGINFDARRFTASPSDGDDFATLIEGWWSSLSRLWPVPQILAGRHFTKGAFIEQHTISALTAVDRLTAAHKRPGKRFEGTRFDGILLALQKSLSEFEYSSLAEREDFSRLLNNTFKNEWSFVRKLEHLIDLIGPEVLAAADIDPKGWLAGAVAARNKLSHTGSHVSTIEDPVAGELDRIDYSTRVIASVLLRRSLGLDDLSPARAARTFRNVNLGVYPPPRWWVDPERVRLGLLGPDGSEVS